MSIAGRNFVGKYQLAKQVGVGTSCTLWDVIDPGDGKRYVLKILQPELRTNKELVAQLRNEYQAGKDISHPNVIGVYEYSTHRDAPYIVLERFRSTNLKQVIREQPDWLAFQTLRILEQAAAGLAAVHEQGWVHRDIKPDNLLVDETGNTKLIDFSLARKEKKGLGRLLSGKSKVQGTRTYMSPEQIRGEPADPRSDIYSFGCMMFELLAGKPPFSGVSSDDLLNKHLRNRAPSVVAINENATPEVADLISRLMAKTPAQRPASMEEVLAELRDLRLFRRPPAPPVASENNTPT